MQIAVFLVGIITTGILLRQLGNKTTESDYKNNKKVNITDSHTYQIKESNDVNPNNINLLTDVEHAILESTVNTSYSFYVIGGWLRDRVS
jgi:hypothetical protein